MRLKSAAREECATILVATSKKYPQLKNIELRVADIPDSKMISAGVSFRSARVANPVIVRKANLAGDTRTIPDGQSCHWEIISVFTAPCATLYSGSQSGWSGRCRSSERIRAAGD
jgi:hypothetical protein